MVEITPIRATLAHREKCEINIEIKAMDIGSYCIKMFYSLRLNEFSDVIIGATEDREIFSFDFKCSWPIIQVKPPSKLFTNQVLKKNTFLDHGNFRTQFWRTIQQN